MIGKIEVKSADLFTEAARGGVDRMDEMDGVDGIALWTSRIVASKVHCVHSVPRTPCACGVLQRKT